MMDKSELSSAVASSPSTIAGEVPVVVTVENSLVLATSVPSDHQEEHHLPPFGCPPQQDWESFEALLRTYAHQTNQNFAIRDCQTVKTFWKKELERKQRQQGAAFSQESYHCIYPEALRYVSKLYVCVHGVKPRSRPTDYSRPRQSYLYKHCEAKIYAHLERVSGTDDFVVVVRRQYNTHSHELYPRSSPIGHSASRKKRKTIDSIEEHLQHLQHHPSHSHAHSGAQGHPLPTHPVFGEALTSQLPQAHLPHSLSLQHPPGSSPFHVVSAVGTPVGSPGQAAHALVHSHVHSELHAHPPPDLHISIENGKAVDHHLTHTLFHQKDIQLKAHLEYCTQNSINHGLETQNCISYAQGKLLQLLAQPTDRILEIGTMGGYATLFMASNLTTGSVTTLEIDSICARVACENMEYANLGDRVHLIEGFALESLQKLQAEGQQFDFVFIDADLASYPEYLRISIELVRVGGLIVANNILREGIVPSVHANGEECVSGVQGFLMLLSSDLRVDSTAFQTLGVKGYEGFSITKRVQ
ncbi:O-methyltransferase-domain-containing protein [Polychytrium aggregatum]|uniref:O-methyltransferase-domain-containing protein n=1 Tax=Polychytrium aggregatum TaxID=110093 RepID=UPI0022FE7B4A|nr:O-methyltransferase-domain-containing protein [Polychytrium aggregatum]KAI9209881.1 O-methyltransferase-domain-containing protein [Polychytrium aggregatum]